MIITGVLLAVAGSIVGGVDGYSEGSFSTAALWATMGLVIGFFVGVLAYCVHTFSVHYFFTIGAIAFVGALAYTVIFE